jgi:hypothetical protein
MATTRPFLALPLLAAAACAAAPSAPPPNVGQPYQEAPATDQASAATIHAGDITPGASGAEGEPSERHRRMAADHRAASGSLRAAEASACAGLRAADRDTSPFERRASVIGVEDLRAHPASVKATQVSTLEGASITLRPEPGMTKEYLQRLVTCHVARNASMNFSMPEMASCPLSVKGASATVESAGSAFRVDIKGDSKDSAEAIVGRARALPLTP